MHLILCLVWATTEKTKLQCDYVVYSTEMNLRIMNLEVYQLCIVSLLGSRYTAYTDCFSYF